MLTIVFNIGLSAMLSQQHLFYQMVRVDLNVTIEIDFPALLLFSWALMFATPVPDSLQRRLFDRRSRRVFRLGPTAVNHKF